MPRAEEVKLSGFEFRPFEKGFGINKRYISPFFFVEGTIKDGKKYPDRFRSWKKNWYRTSLSKNRVKYSGICIVSHEFSIFWVFLWRDLKNIWDMLRWLPSLFFSEGVKQLSCRVFWHFAPGCIHKWWSRVENKISEINQTSFGGLLRVNYGVVIVEAWLLERHHSLISNNSVSFWCTSEKKQKTTFGQWANGWLGGWQIAGEILPSKFTKETHRVAEKGPEVRFFNCPSWSFRKFRTPPMVILVEMAEDFIFGRILQKKKTGSNYNIDWRDWTLINSLHPKIEKTKLDQLLLLKPSWKCCRTA